MSDLRCLLDIKVAVVSRQLESRSLEFKEETGPRYKFTIILQKVECRIYPG